MATIYAPIWRDTYYTGTTDEFEYHIDLDGEEIYRGIGYIAPDSSILRINISKICEDYLSCSLPDFRGLSGGTFTHTDAYRSFLLYDSGTTLLNTYNFLYCWDYLTDFTGGTTNLSHPIDRRYAPGMKLFSTAFSGGSVITTLASSGNGYNEVSCGNGAVYYKNRSGGWDSYLVRGTIKRNDTYQKYSYNRSFDNNTIEFEEGTYHNQVRVKWTLNSGWLTDTQSRTLAFNLIPSNAIYFHNFQDNTIVPCICTLSNTDYKTFRGEKNKLVNYQITLEESQKKQIL